MITLQNLLDYSQANELSSELYGVCDTVKYNWMKLEEVYDHSNSTRHLDWDFGFTVKFGFEFKPNVWYWFYGMVFQDDGSDVTMDLNMNFRQRYNRGNGACQKTFTKGWECERVINEFLN